MNLNDLSLRSAVIALLEINHFGITILDDFIDADEEKAEECMKKWISNDCSKVDVWEKIKDMNCTFSDKMEFIEEIFGEENSILTGKVICSNPNNVDCGEVLPGGYAVGNLSFDFRDSKTFVEDGRVVFELESFYMELLNINLLENDDDEIPIFSEEEFFERLKDEFDGEMSELSLYEGEGKEGNFEIIYFEIEYAGEKLILVDKDGADNDSSQ